MMLEAMGWVLDSSVPNPSKAVLVALANWSDEDNSCSPSIERVAQVASISPERVLLELDHLQKTGMVKVQPHHSIEDGTLGVRYYLQVGAEYVPPTASSEPRLPSSDGYTTVRRDVLRALVGNPLAFSVYSLLLVAADQRGVAQMSIRAMAEHGGVAEHEVLSALEAILATPHAVQREPSSIEGDRIIVQLRPDVDFQSPYSDAPDWEA